MKRKLASIQKIKKIEPIKNADKIEKATVLGWSCVVKKGDFKENSLCVYFEIDSLIPRKAWSDFLFKKDDKKDKFRLRTVRLRGQISQGLVMPLSIIPCEPQEDGKPFYQLGMFQEGFDLTEILGVEKYEPYIPAQLSGVVKSTFPSWIPKTDETRIQAEPQVLDRYKGETFYVTEKLDGSSMTVYLNEGEFGICSRRMDLQETEENTFWRVARELKIEENLRKFGYDNMALQGELIGQGVQGNKYKLEGNTFRVFNVFDIGNHEYLDYVGMVSTANFLGLETVPILKQTFKLNHTVDELVEVSKGKSKLNSKTEREGIVLRPLDEKRDEDLGRLSFKVINPQFLLKYKE